MKLNYLREQLETVGRWMVTTLCYGFTIALIWQGAFLSTPAALANPVVNLVASADAGDQVKGKTREVLGSSKNFIRDTADKVEETANKNADRVEKATDGKGSFVERKAKRDAARIAKRAEEDAARTQKAVDKTKNAVEGAVDKVKDVLGQ